MEFHFPAANPDAKRLTHVIRSCSAGTATVQAVAPLKIAAYLKGFIDLVFVFEGRYHPATEAELLKVKGMGKKRVQDLLALIHASAAGLPMTWGDDVLAVLPGTLAEDDLAARLEGADAAVIMKLGSNFPKVRRAIVSAGLAHRAIYIERGSMDGEIVLPLSDKTDDTSPYFSLILIGGEGRRP